MKKSILKLGFALTRFGERHNIRPLIYNPITWAFFFATSRREGSAFTKVVREVFPDVSSAIDVGSGGGGYVAKLNTAGIRAIGLEYSPVGRLLGQLQGVEVLPFDCSDLGDLEKLGPYDLAFSIEVGEHLPPVLSEEFVRFIAGRSNLVVFSAAHPGQGGHGHINEQTKEYWAGLFDRHGFKKEPEMETRFSSLLNSVGYKGWLPTNLQIFRKAA